jgi:glutaredoxin
MRVALRNTVLALLFCTAGAHAQLYKWVGPDGKVTYSDTPPPPSARQAEQKAVPRGGQDNGLPYELAEAARAHPVTLYTMPECVPCDLGRTLLIARGIPFSERTVSTNADIEHLRSVGGSTQLPLLRVGRDSREGFQEQAWHGLLTAAGYPATSRLPKNYRWPAPAPAAPASAAPGAAEPQQQAPDADTQQPPALSTQQPPPAGNAPPGFRF